MLTVRQAGLLQLARTHRVQGRLDAAIAAFAELLRAVPDDVTLWREIAATCAAAGRDEDAAAAYSRITRLEPDRPASWIDFGAACVALHRYDDARSAYATALRLAPDDVEARFGRSFVQLLHDEIPAGWEALALQTQLPGRCAGYAALHGVPRWDGTPLSGGSVLIARDGGFGDAIQFWRFVANVKARAGRVILACAPELATLAQTLAGVDEIRIADGTHDDAPDVDAYVPLCALPAVLRIDRTEIARPIPYLRADLAQVACMRERIGRAPGRRNAGLVWAGNPDFAGDVQRSTRLARLAPLFTASGLRWIALQTGARAEEPAPPGATLERIELDLRDFAQTAAALKALDLLVTTDTAIAHLAGALGVPTIVMLPYAADWRWGIDRAESPWYPSLRLVRQARPGDWEELAARARECASAWSL
jgi:hypothetical protein